MKIVNAILGFCEGVFKATGKVFGILLAIIGLLLVGGIFGADGVKTLVLVALFIVFVRLFKMMIQAKN